MSLSGTLHTSENIFSATHNVIRVHKVISVCMQDQHQDQYADTGAGLILTPVGAGPVYVVQDRCAQGDVDGAWGVLCCVSHAPCIP